MNLAVMALLGLFGLSMPALAANECKIKYGWNTGNSLAGTFKNHSRTVYLNKGQTKTINKSRMNYVKSLKTRKVKFYLSSGASDVTLGKDQRNPLVGTYTNTPRLDKVKCLNTSTTSSSSPSITPTPAQLVQTLKNQGVAVQDIAKQLQNTLNQSKNNIAILLKGGGFSKSQIAFALKSGLSANATQILSAIKGAFSDLSRKSGAQLLKSQAFSVRDIVKAIVSAMGGTHQQIVKAMRDAGFTNQNQITEILVTIVMIEVNIVVTVVTFGASGSAVQMAMPAILEAFRLAGYTTLQAGAALKAGTTATRAQAEQALKAAGFVKSQILAALNKYYGIAKRAEKNVGRQAANARDLVGDCGKMGVVRVPAPPAPFVPTPYPDLHKCAGVMKSAGKSVTYIAGVLKVGFRQNVANIAQLLKAVRFTANQTAKGLKDGAKATADQTTAALKSYFRLTQNQAKAALQYARYTASQILAALNKYYGQARQAADRAVKDVQRRLNTSQQGLGLGRPAVAAAAKELQGWFIKAEIYKSKCRVNAVTAVGTPGVFRSSYRWQGLVKKALTATGLSSSVATNWDNAYKKAFDDWARNVTIPGLPWYPAFAAYPAGKVSSQTTATSKGITVPPTPNVPTPLASLVSRFTPGMAPPNLKKKIFSSLGNAANAETKDAASYFATHIGGRFGKFLGVAQVMTVMGSGRVQIAGPGSAVGPVVGGSCWGKNVLVSSAGTF